MLDDAVVWTDESGKIVSCNKAFHAMTNRPHDEVVGGCFADLAPLTRARLPLGSGEHPVDHVLASPDAVRETLELALGDTRRTLEIHGARSVLPGGGAALVFVLRDQDALARAEEAAREASRQLTVTNQELQSFLQSISHDLRAPLRTIDGFSQALSEDYAAVLDARGHGYVARVRAGVARMVHLLDDLLGLSRLASAELHDEPVDLSRLAREIAEGLAQTHPDQAVTVAIQADVTCRGDSRLLGVVLASLFDNAWKFTAKVEHPRVEFGVHDERDRSVCFVRDNGVGFDMAHKDRLFIPFQRLHPVEEYPGAGVGLAAVRRIVHRHGGTTWAEGATGAGATFSFTLPTLVVGAGAAAVEARTQDRAPRTT